MHLLTTSSTNLDEIVEAVDLGQTPGDIAVLSFADSDLAALAAAWEAERASLPSVRLAHLRDLRHPMSVDLWIDRVGAHAKVIVVRLLGGLDWWKYGIERLVGAGARTRHRARRAARRGSRRCSACCRVHAAGAGARRVAALLPRRRPRQSARAAAPAGASCRTRSRIARAAAGAAPCRLSPGRGRGRSRPLGWRRCKPATRWCRSSSTARCCSPTTPRRSTRYARRSRARLGAGGAVRHQLEGSRGRRVSAPGARAARSRH